MEGANVNNYSNLNTVKKKKKFVISSDCMNLEGNDVVSLELKKFCELLNVEDQLKGLKQLSRKYLEVGDNKEINDKFVQYAVNIYIAAEPKNPLKNAVAHMLSAASSPLKNIIKNELCKQINSKVLIFDSLYKYSKDMSKIFNESVSTLSITMNFPLGQEAIANNFPKTLGFLENCFVYYHNGLEIERAPSTREELHQNVHNAVRVFVSLHQCCNGDQVKFDVRNCAGEHDDAEFKMLIERRLLKILCCLLTVEDLPLDVGNTCALALVTFAYQTNISLWRELLSICVSGEKSSFFTELLPLSSTTHLNLCMGLLGGLAVEDLVLPQSGKNFRLSPLAMILSVLLELSQTKPCQPILELGSARGIQKVLRIIGHVLTVNCASSDMKKLKISNNQESNDIKYSPNNFNGDFSLESVKDLVHDFLIKESPKILPILWLQMEHFLDSIRHAARGSLQTYANIACVLEVEGKKCLNMQLQTALAALPTYRRARYIVLSAAASGGFQRFAVSLSVAAGITPDELVEAIVCRDSTVRPHAAAAFEALMSADAPGTNASAEQLETWLKHWVQPVLESLSNSTYLPSHSDLEALLVKAVEHYPTDIVKLVLESFNKCGKDFSSCTSGTLLSLLVCVRAARVHGIFDSKFDNDLLWKGIIPFDVLYGAAIHFNDEMRLSSLALVVETHRSTESPTAGELRIVRTVLEHSITSQQASTRQRIGALFKRLLTRISDCCTPAAKRRQSNPTEVAELCSNFLNWSVDFAVKNLFPGANFERRCLSLQILRLMVEQLKTGVPDCFWLPSNGSVLIEMLKDSYEDNKFTAATVLKHFPSVALKLNDENFVFSLLSTCEELAKSYRPPNSITAAYLLHMIVSFPFEKGVLSAISQIEIALKSVPINVLPQNHETRFRILHLYTHILEQQICLAKENLMAAVSTGPMYGVLFCIRLLLKNVDMYLVVKFGNWFDLLHRIIKCCYSATESVEPVVNSESPEGHMPMDDQLLSDIVESVGEEDLSGKQGFNVTAQQVLLCAWRTVKESSLLLGWLAQHSPLGALSGPSDAALVTEEQLLIMGLHFTRLLSEVKHRGAFEQVYVGFCLLCSRIWSLGENNSGKNESLGSSIHDLPVCWLNELLNLISSAGVDSTSRLCSTRRSAGVPFLVQALLSTQPSSAGCTPVFQQCVERLLVFAETHNNPDTCTHALNILRAIFRCANLREPSVSYISQTVMVAIHCCRAKTWSERNAATLLFSTLLVRLFGVGRPGNRIRRTTGRVFFHQYPLLFDFLIKEISSSAQGMTENSPVSMHQFPALLLLSCLHPNSLEGSDSSLQLSCFIPLVNACARSTSESIRKLAARALAPIVSPGEWMDVIDDLLTTASASDKTPWNVRHGLLLQVLSLLQTFSNHLKKDTDILLRSSKWLELSQCLLCVSYHDHPCFFTAEAYIQIVQILADAVFFSNVITAPMKHFREVDGTVKGYEAFKLENEKSLFKNSCWTTILCAVTQEIDWLKGKNTCQGEPGLNLYQMRASQLKLFLTNVLFPENTMSYLSEMLLSESQDMVYVALNFISYSMGLSNMRLPFEPPMEEMKDVHIPAVFRDLGPSLISNHNLAKAIASLFFMQGNILLPDCRLFAFQLFPHLPLVIKYVGDRLIDLSRSETSNIHVTTGEEYPGDVVLHWLLKELENDAVGVGPPLIAVFGVFLLSVTNANKDSEVMLSISSNSLAVICSVLEHASSPECSFEIRLSVAELLSSKNMSLLLCNPSLESFSPVTFSNLWTAAIQLLDDDSFTVRKQVSRIALYLPESTGLPVTDVKARELFVLQFVNTMVVHDPLCVAATLTSWILRNSGFVEENVVEQQLFDETETNLYGESFPLALIASDSLKYVVQQNPSLVDKSLETCVCELLANRCWNATFTQNLEYHSLIPKKRALLSEGSQWGSLSEFVVGVEQHLKSVKTTFEIKSDLPQEILSFVNPLSVCTSNVEARIALLQKAIHHFS